MKKKFLSLAIVFMLTIAGVVGSLCLNNTMATYGATTTKIFKMKDDLNTLYLNGIECPNAPFEINAGGTTFSGNVWEGNDSILLFVSEDESKSVMYSGHAWYGNSGWYIGTKKDSTSLTVATFASSIKLLAASPSSYYDNYNFTTLSEPPTITLTDDENSTLFQFLGSYSEPEQLPSTGIMFDNKNYTMPLIILGSMLTLTGVAMLVLVKKKKQN